MCTLYRSAAPCIVLPLLKQSHPTAAGVTARYRRRHSVHNCQKPTIYNWVFFFLCLFVAYHSICTFVSTLSLSLSAAALSMLRLSEDQAPVPQNKFMGDIEELASGYERKLIEVGAVSLHSLRRISHDTHPGSGAFLCSRRSPLMSRHLMGGLA